MTQDADAGNGVTSQQFTVLGRTNSDTAMRRKSSQRITAQEGSRILEKFIKQPSNAEEDTEGKCIVITLSRLFRVLILSVALV